MDRNIVLTGLMGAGKTTLGKHIAKKTGFKFADTDELIIQKAKQSITEIFEDHGESHFRELESEIIKEVSQTTGYVISTGGGAVLREENITNLKKTGVLFYLEASVETLWERVKNNSSRPLLKGDNPENILKKTLTARESFYKKADFTVNTEDKTLEEVAKQILELYSQFSA